MPFTPSMAELIAEMNRLSTLLDKGLGELYRAAVKSAEADVEYKVSYSTAILEAEGGTVSEREAWAHKATQDQRLKFKLAEALLLSAQEAVRSRRQQISACQSVANAMRAEAEFARTGPGVSP
jgi:hypothetical protein